MVTGRGTEICLSPVADIIDGRAGFVLMMGFLCGCCTAGGIAIIIATKNVGPIVGIDGRQVGHEFWRWLVVPVQCRIQITPSQAVLCLFYVGAAIRHVPVRLVVGAEGITS